MRLNLAIIFSGKKNANDKGLMELEMSATAVRGCVYACSSGI